MFGNVKWESFELKLRASLRVFVSRSICVKAKSVQGFNLKAVRLPRQVDVNSVVAEPKMVWLYLPCDGGAANRTRVAENIHPIFAKAHFPHS